MLTTAAVLDSLNQPFRIEEMEIDEPRPGEVLVQLVGTGVCHTDSLAQHGDFPFAFPGVLGHEGAGKVAAVGEGVRSVAEGDAVLIGWPWCGSCRNCLDGQPRYCEQLGPLVFQGGRDDGSTALRTRGGDAVHSHFFGQSSFAGHAITSENSLVKVPSEMDLATAGPLGCGIATGAGAVLNVLKPRPGSSLVVFGAGNVGLAGIMAARCSGASRIVAVDRHADRLKLARELGATDTIDVADGDVVEAVKDICGGPAELALECTGNLGVVRQAIDSIGPRGTCALVGAAPFGAEFTVEHGPTLWGKRIVGVLGGEGTSVALIGALIELHLQGRFPFDRLIQPFPLDQINEAMAASHSGDVLKPVLRMPS